VGVERIIDAIERACLDVNGLSAIELAAIVERAGGELVAALESRSLRVEVRVDEPPRAMRLLLMEDGRVVPVSDAMLLGRAFDPNVLLTGRLGDVLSVVLGAMGLKDAVRKAILVTDVALVDLTPVRDAVARAFREAWPS
jgi:hypothetical protein